MAGGMNWKSHKPRDAFVDSLLWLGGGLCAPTPPSFVRIDKQINVDPPVCEHLLQFALLSSVVFAKRTNHCLIKDLKSPSDPTDF